uniref:(northern house mosquito) hypothetical protein n=1 Tax=Culex pipiens TaxID=7175 RepID=A0A8D8FMY8_CULPI
MWSRASYSCMKSAYIFCSSGFAANLLSIPISRFTAVAFDSPNRLITSSFFGRVTTKRPCSSRTVVLSKNSSQADSSSEWVLMLRHVSSSQNFARSACSCAVETTNVDDCSVAVLFGTRPEMIQPNTVSWSVGPSSVAFCFPSRSRSMKNSAPMMRSIGFDSKN